jgi:hypothetical protein
MIEAEIDEIVPQMLEPEEDEDFDISLKCGEVRIFFVIIQC